MSKQSPKRASGVSRNSSSKFQAVSQDSGIIHCGDSAVAVSCDNVNDDDIHSSHDESALISTGDVRSEIDVSSVSVFVKDVAAVHVVESVPADHGAPVSSPIKSPGHNRDRFMNNCQPLRVSCNLGAVGLHSSGVRFSFQAVVFVVYPASDKPDRRHVLLIDSSGCCGLTVWGAHVPLFSFASVGSVVKFTKLGMTVHNGRKSLSMGRDTTLMFVPSSVVTEESKWWHSLAATGYNRIIDVHDCADDSVINVAGIVGLLSSETKRVRSDNKDLLTMRFTDRSGWVDVRSWNHSEAEFSSFLEKPLLLQRVRVTSFSGIKILEILEGDGTIVAPSFSGMKDLEDYWQE
jgi:hypothetical protein